VDGVLVLEKASRTGHDAKLTIANRDTEGFCFKLLFDPDNCKWLFIGNDGGKPEEKTDEPDEQNLWLFLLVDTFLKDDSWSGTATELADALRKLDPDADLITPRTITKMLKANESYLKKNHISLAFDRNRDSRAITITRDAWASSSAEAERPARQEKESEGEQEQLNLPDCDVVTT